MTRKIILLAILLIGLMPGFRKEGFFISAGIEGYAQGEMTQLEICGTIQDFFVGTTGNMELWEVCYQSIYCQTYEVVNQDCHSEWRAAAGGGEEEEEDSGDGGGGYSGGGGGSGGGDPGGGGDPTSPPDCSSNTAFSASSASASSGASPTTPLSSMPGVYGYVSPETISISISACYDGTNWNAILTSLSGRYAKQTRLLPGQTEITGIGGNTTSSNFCDQLICLTHLGNNSGAAWYMISAVDAHESVHATRMEPALEQVASLVESSIESLSIPYTGQTQSAAIAQIKALQGFRDAIGAAFQAWDQKISLLVAGDHGSNGYATVAERGVTVPMASSICTHALSNGWPTCGVCP